MKTVKFYKNQMPKLTKSKRQYLENNYEKMDLTDYGTIHWNHLAVSIKDTNYIKQNISIDNLETIEHNLANDGGYWREIITALVAGVYHNNFKNGIDYFDPITLTPVEGKNETNRLSTNGVTKITGRIMPGIITSYQDIDNCLQQKAPEFIVGGYTRQGELIKVVRFKTEHTEIKTKFYNDFDRISQRQKQGKSLKSNLEANYKDFATSASLVLNYFNHSHSHLLNKNYKSILEDRFNLV